MGPNDYARQLLKISVVQILQTIGFKGTHQIPLTILVELLERYIAKLCSCAKDFSELANRTEPNLDDVACALDRFKVSTGELEEFMNWVDTPEFAVEKHAVAGKAWSDVLPPPRRAAKLNYCESESKDRESDEEFEHVYDFMPVMKQQLPDPTAAVTSMETAVAENTVRPLERSVTDVQMTSPPKPSDEQRQQQQMEIIKRQLSMKAQAVVKKNGRTFSNYTWDSMFKPALIHSELKSFSCGADSSMMQGTIDKQHGDAKVPEAKMPPYYHKPRLRQRKQHLLDLAANLNKPTASASLVNIALTATTATEEPFKPLVKSESEAVIVEELINPISTVKSADEVYTSLEIEKTAIFLEDIPKELETEATTDQKVAEVKQFRLKIKEKHIVETAGPDGQFSMVNTPDSDAKRLPAIPKLKIASLKKNLTSNNNATSSPMASADPLRGQKPVYLGGYKDNTPKRTESVVFDSSQIFAIDLGLDEEEDLANSIVAESKERRQSNLDDRSNKSKAFWAEDDHEEGEVVEQPISIKIKRTKDVTSVEEGADGPVDAEPSRYRNSEQQAEFNYGLDGDNFDDNAMDGIDSIASKAAAAAATSSVKEQPALIWKPNRSDTKPSRQSNDDGAPALAPFSIAPMAKPKSLSLVDITYLSSNSNDSVSRPPVGGAASLATVTNEDADTRSSVLSNQSNQLQRVVASKDNTSGEVTKSKKNKDKKKSKDKDKEKKKKQPTESIDENEQRIEAVSVSEPVDELGGEGKESNSSSKHKKKKKNKDKHKTGEKCKDKQKDKKHHHHEHGKEKSKKSSKSDGEDKDSSETPDLATSPDGSSKKLDKKLKKQLKKQQKRLEKSANALVIMPDVESMHHNQEIDVETVHDHEESQAQNLINDLEAGEIRRPVQADVVDLAAPRLPKIKLKLGGSSTLVSGPSPLDISVETPTLAEPKEVVKPLKISLGKKPLDKDSTGLVLNFTTKTELTTGEEVELGEIVRPKLPTGFSQEPPKLQPHPIPKLIIKPQKPSTPAELGGADDQQAMFKLKHKDSSLANRDSTKKRKMPNQQQIPQLQYTPQNLDPSYQAMDDQGSAIDFEQAAYMNASTAAGLNFSFSKKQRLSSLNDASDSPPLLTAASGHHGRSQPTAAQMRIVSCRTEETSQQVWICPSCKKADQGSMIGCDSCDDWYHWKCVGISQEPPDDQNWYCNKCGATDHHKNAAAAAAGVDEAGSAKSETFDDARSDTSELSVTYDANGELVRKVKKQLPP